jgi:hypothetical protein
LLIAGVAIYFYSHGQMRLHYGSLPSKPLQLYLKSLDLV